MNSFLNKKVRLICELRNLNGYFPLNHFNSEKFYDIIKL